MVLFFCVLEGHMETKLGLIAVERAAVMESNKFILKQYGQISGMRFAGARQHKVLSAVSFRGDARRV